MLDSESELDSEDEKEEEPTMKNIKKRFSSRQKDSDYGRVVCVDYADKRGTKTKEIWFPAMISDPNDAPAGFAAITPKDLKLAKDLITVRSFRDGRFYNVSRRDAREFNKDSVKSFMDSPGCISELRSALYKAVVYLETATLPEGWNMGGRYTGGGGDDTDYSNLDDESSNSQMTSTSRGSRRVSKRKDIGSTAEPSSTTPTPAEGKNTDQEDNADQEEREEEEEEEDEEDDDDLSDLEIEVKDDDDEELMAEKERRRAKLDAERDGFIARLMAFMDARRGPPISYEQMPVINGKELDIYHLHLIVNKMGGPNRVKSRKKWARVYQCLGLPPPAEEWSAGRYEEEENSVDADGTGILSDNSPVSQLRRAYDTYLLHFTDITRKVGGVTMLSDLSRRHTYRARGPGKKENEATTPGTSSLGGSASFGTPVAGTSTSSATPAAATSVRKSSTTSKSSKSAQRQTSDRTNCTSPSSSNWERSGSPLSALSAPSTASSSSSNKDDHQVISTATKEGSKQSSGGKGGKTEEKSKFCCLHFLMFSNVFFNL